MFGDLEYSDEPTGGGGGNGSDMIGAIIAAGASMYDSHKNRQQSKQNTQMTIDAQKREAELAYQRSVEQWNRQNMYNTPEAQMARFRAGGLNPHLIYGQGNAGNASGYPEYQPADIKYNVEAAQYGSAVSGAIPTLMAIGTWMQNMRLMEASYQKTKVDTMKAESDTDRVRQLIEYLREQNPQMVKEKRNKLDLFEFQKEAADYGRNIARTKLFDMEQEFRYKYGDDLFSEFDSAWQSKSKDGKRAPIGGAKRLEFLQQQSKAKLLEAQSSWADMDITNPQAIMMMVLNGVMGLAGASLRMKAPGKSSATPSKSRPQGLRRVHPARRVQSKPKGYYD